MEKKDEFGHDPAIRGMRRVFAQMETAQRDLLTDAGLSPFDPRLRRWREAARPLFEQGWSKAIRQGLQLTEEEAGMLYGVSLKRLMERDGVPFSKPGAFGQEDPRLERILELVP